jgi:hypothetical protein
MYDRTLPDNRQQLMDCREKIAARTTAALPFQAAATSFSATKYFCFL